MIWTSAPLLRARAVPSSSGVVEFSNEVEFAREADALDPARCNAPRLQHRDVPTIRLSAETGRRLASRTSRPASRRTPRRAPRRRATRPRAAWCASVSPRASAAVRSPGTSALRHAPQYYRSRSFPARAAITITTLESAKRQPSSRWKPNPEPPRSARGRSARTRRRRRGRGAPPQAWCGGARRPGSGVDPSSSAG